MEFYRVNHSFITHDLGYFAGPHSFDIDDFGWLKYVEFKDALSRLYVNKGYWLPPASSEFPEVDMMHYICGFNSMEQANKWFGGFWNTFFRYGFCIRKYDVDIMVAEHQSIALAEKIVELETYGRCERFDRLPKTVSVH